MFPLFALFLCSVFVGWLLILEHRETPQVSIALWIPTIWMIIIGSRPVAAWFLMPGSVEDSNSSILDQIAFITLFASALFVLIRRQFNWIQLIKNNIWLFLLIYYMLISTFWSDIGFISIKRWTREIIAITMAAVVISEQNPRKAVLSVIKRSVFILIPFSLLLIKYFPAFGVEYGRWSGEIMWIGVTMQKNGLGRLCMISVFFLVWKFYTRQKNLPQNHTRFDMWSEIFILLISIRLLIGPTIQAYSATAVTALMLAFIFFALLAWLTKIKISMTSVPVDFGLVMIMLFGVITVFLGGASVSTFTSSLARDSTLTGRTEIWADLLPIAMERPIQGHGFGGFWTPETRVKYNISEAHSGYLDLLLETGFCGLILILIFFYLSFRAAQQRLNSDFSWAIMWICFLIMAAVHNISETSITSFTTHLTAVILFIHTTSTSIPRKLSSDILTEERMTCFHKNRKVPA